MLTNRLRTAKSKLAICFSLIFMLSCFATNAFALSCQQVQQFTVLYLKYHYSVDTFDDELAKRTLDSFIKAWDPGKLYFYQSDIDTFKKKYETKLDDLIRAGKCSAINDVINVYAKRFEERHKIIPKLIAAKHDFTIDEYMNVDRKKIKYAKTDEELTERWRQRVKFQLLQLKQTLDGDMTKAREKLAKRYERVIKRHNEQTIDTVYGLFLNSFSTSLDPHSSYLPAEQLEDFRIETKLSLEGIGAVLRSEDGYTVIQSLVPGGAAAKSNKIKVEDKIIAVAQDDGAPVDVIDMDLREVVKLIRGTPGTVVTLTLLRREASESTKKIVPVVREKIQLQDRMTKSEVLEVQVKDSPKSAPKMQKIGVISLPSFYVDFEGMHQKKKDYRSSARDLKNEIKKLEKQKVDAIVLDLRNNGGGSLEESIRIAGLFFDEGPVVQIKSVDGSIQAQSDDDGITYYDGPLTLMVNRQSASASEILAGAIQDYNRGIIIGDSHTFGKGTVQNLNNIGDKLGAVKITISKFYRPSGSSTQLKGVTSDIVLPSLVDELEIGEKHYDYAMAWDQIKPVKYDKFNLRTPYLDKLRKRSQERISHDDGFEKIKDEIAKYKEEEDDRYRISLKEEPKKDEKTASTKGDAKKEDDKDVEEDELFTMGTEINVKDDIALQEALRITSDYVRLLEKQKPALVSIPVLKKEAVVANVKEAKPATTAKAKEAKKE